MELEGKINKKVFRRIAIVSICCFFLVSMFVVFSIKYDSRQKSRIKLNSYKLKELCKTNVINLEYGTNLKYDELYKKIINKDSCKENCKVLMYLNNKKLIENKEYSFLNLGVLKIKVIITKQQTQKKELQFNIDKSSIISFVKNYKIKFEPIENKFETTVTINVADSNKPEIEGVSDKDIYVGTNIDLKEGITAKDKVDGQLDIQIEGTVDINKAGEYLIKVKAVDKNNNETTKEFKVNVKEKPKTQITRNTQVQATVKHNYNNQTSITKNTEPVKYSKTVPDMLNIINAERTKQGLPSLKWDNSLATGAKIRAKELLISFSHNRPDGRDPFTVIQGSYSNAGENIAAGQKSNSEVMNSWMNSAGHRANILSSNYTKVGAAMVYDSESPFGYYWVQLFTN